MTNLTYISTKIQPKLKYAASHTVLEGRPHKNSIFLRKVRYFFVIGKECKMATLIIRSVSICSILTVVSCKKMYLAPILLRERQNTNQLPRSSQNHPEPVRPSSTCLHQSHSSKDSYFHQIHLCIEL